MTDEKEGELAKETFLRKAKTESNNQEFILDHQT